MKNSYIRLLFFLVLMLALVVGLSYLSLHHVSKKKDEPDDKKMDVALVNEDDGTIFNRKELAFGDKFVKSVDKNDDHDWNIVSRGVAESGLDRGTYDMMVVIPEDFSQKALSMESEEPEQVDLDYKINASDNDKVQAQAEKTASSILNDMNRQIIDVYFASVIGNLQDAQDDVGDLVDEEAENTHTYNNAVHNPISGYTDQFARVKNSTGTSKDSFTGLKDTLGSFGDRLSDKVDSNQDYLSSIEQAEERKETASALNLDFTDQLNKNHDRLNDEDIDKQLEDLQAANEYINQQFQEDENKTEEQNEEDTEALEDRVSQLHGEDTDGPIGNIATDTKILKDRLNEALEQVEEKHQDLEKELGEDGRINEEIEEQLSDAFDDEMNDDEMNPLNELFTVQDDRTKEKLEDQISRLPSMNKGSIEDADLSPGIKQEILNVINITEKYQDEFAHVAPETQDQEILPDHIQALKNHLHEDGVTITDTVKIPENENEMQQFKLDDIPDEYTIAQLSLDIPGIGEKNYSEQAQKNKRFEIPSNPEEGEFTVVLQLKLKDKYVDRHLKSDDIYQSKTWGWRLYQNDTDGKLDKKNGNKQASIQNPNASLVASKTTDAKENAESAKDQDSELTSTSDSEDEEDDAPSESDEEDDEDHDASSESENDEDDKSDSASDTEDEEADNDDASSGSEDKEDNEDDATSDSGDEEDEEDDASSDSEDDEKDESDSAEDDSGNNESSDKDDDDNEEDEPEEVEIKNDQIRHKVTEPVIDESTEDLIHTVENTISPYQKLLSTYEFYFGLDLSCSNQEECVPIHDRTEDWEDTSLKDMASEDSQYDLFNKKDINGLLTDYVMDQIKDVVTDEISEPFENLEDQIDDYQDFIYETDENAAALVEKVEETREQSRSLNGDVDEMIDDITAWREESLNLVDSQSEIQDKNDEEQSTVMELGSEFEPLLTQSQSLADQASNNMDSADNVYQTFDRIDNQATSIQESGTDLVQQAEDLSFNMTEKVADDQDFADNFGDVMANSQIGDRQNEDLYKFLSNPVDTKNKGLIVNGNTFTPYFLVLIGFIVALFTAYVISTTHQRRNSGGAFEAEQSLMGSNALITGITACIGIVEGVVIGLFSAHYLGISEGNLVTWTGFMILVMLVMLLVSAYLLRQLRMIGMFILLAVLSLYLFLTRALGSSFSGSDELRAYSPLQYLENILTNAVQGESADIFLLFGVIVLIVLAALANLLVLHRTKGHTTEDDEDAAKA